jgi:tetratricopeptide (TPR) repeat protein
MGRLTPSLQRAFQQAAKVASADARLADTTDLLRALFGESDSAAAKILQQAGIHQAHLPAAEDEGDGGVFSGGLTRTVERAGYLAAGLPQFSSSQVLLSLLREESGSAGRWLREQDLESKVVDWQQYQDPRESPTVAKGPHEEQFIWLVYMLVFFGFQLSGDWWAHQVLCFCAVLWLPNAILYWTTPGGWIRLSPECPRCHRQCEFAGMFDPDTGLCRPCGRAVASTPAHRYVAIVAGISAVSAGVALIGADASPWLRVLGLMCTNILLTIVLRAAFNLVHEFGHALAAVLLGKRVLSVHFGSGPVVVKSRIAGVWWYLHFPLQGGLTTIVPGSSNSHKLASFLFVAAGPATHFIFLLLLWKFAGPELNLALNEASVWSTQSNLLAVAFYVNIVALVVNLVPSNVVLANGQQVPNDGKRLWAALSGSPHASQKLQQQLCYVLADMYANYGNLEAQLALFRSPAFSVEPDTGLQMSEMLLLLRMKRQAEALKIAKTFGEPVGDSPEERALVANSLAWVFLKCGETPTADRLSSTAIELFPTLVSAWGTRGEVLLALGRFEESRELLTKAAHQHYSHDSLCYNLSALARLAALESDQAEYDRLRGLVQLLDPLFDLPSSMQEQLAELADQGLQAAQV